MKRFHAHIYFEPAELEKAHDLARRARLINLFPFVGICEQAVGPHPLGMIEVHFSESSSTPVLNWLQANRGTFSVLVHQDTGDDFSDHTDGIQWLGNKLELDFEFFKLIQSHPELQIHPKK